MAELIQPNEVFFTAAEPVQSNRFIMTIEGIPSFIIRAAGAPKNRSNVVVMPHINVERKVKGRTVWEDIDITLYNFIVPSGAQTAMEWLRQGHESVTGRDGYSDFYKKDITFNPLGPPGDKVQEWTLKGAFISAADFGEFDFSTDDVNSIRLTISYDYAILQY
jgi:hypothetical protein